MSSRAFGQVSIVLQGTVCFSAGLHAWAFSIPQFAKTYAAKTSTPYEKWVDRLWGEHFLDPKTGKWQKTKTNDNVRGFVKFIYEPIFNIIQAAMNDQKDKLWAMCDKLGITAKLSSQDKEQTAKPLMKTIMRVLTLHTPAYDQRSDNAAFQCVGDRCMHLHVSTPQHSPLLTIP